MIEQPRDDPRHGWRKRAGNPLMYDTIGATQFAILTLFFGLRERHKLLEIGAGVLRAARFIIPYLDAGHYYGVEPNTESVRLGVEFELGPEMTQRKKPHFINRGDFIFHEIGQRFDYILSYSVFPHVPPPQIPIIFQNAAKCFHHHTIMLATAVFVEGEEQIIDAQKWTKRPVNRYSFARFEEMARTAGLKLIRLGKVYQDWFVAFKEENQAALQSAEEMRKVEWSAVIPKWEDPGWAKG